MRPTTSLLLDPIFTLEPLQLKQGMDAAELGCGGHGHFVFPMAKLVGQSGRIYAVDIRKPALNLIERQAQLEKISQIVPIWSDIEEVGATDILPSSLQRATLLNTLHQVKNQLGALREARRLLADEGLLLVVDWVPQSVIFGPAPANRVALEELIPLAQKAGFTPVMHYQPGPYHFGVLFSAAAK